MRAGIDRHSRTFLWLCPISFCNVKFGLLGGGWPFGMPPVQSRSKVMSVDCTLLLGTCITVIVFAVSVSIYYSALEMLFILKIDQAKGTLNSPIH